ncbi:Gluconate transport-inducing protein [Coemansia sp. RSA 1972]|nr:Gluconate transport-inducing protein [Coemansia sp. RSA 1972]
MARMEPTYRGYIATTDDALLMFEACRLGMLQRRTHRLCERERSMLDSGCVYVWDESESGIRRWTDGKRWSPSRVNGCFLSYTELEPKNDAQLPGMHMSASSDVPLDNGMTKKSMTLFTTQNSKLHLICYYCKSDVDSGRLVTPSQDPRLCDISIPRSLYPEILPEIPRTVAPHTLPMRNRRLSGVPATIMVRGCSSLQHQYQQEYQQPAKIYPRPNNTLAPVPPAYNRSLTSDDYSYVQGSRVSSAHTMHATPETSPLPHERTTVASPATVNQPPPALPSMAPHARRYPTHTLTIPIHAPHSFRSLSSPMAHMSALPTPPLMQSPLDPPSAPSSRRSTLQEWSDSTTIHGTSNAQGSLGMHNSKPIQDTGRVQLPPISELLQSIGRKSPVHPTHALPLHKQGTKVSKIDSNQLAALARARYSGTIWNQQPAPN